MSPTKINIILELVSTSTPRQISRMGALFDSCRDEYVGPWIIVKNKKKKNSWDPSPVSLAEIRSREKADIDRSDVDTTN